MSLKDRVLDLYLSKTPDYIDENTFEENVNEVLLDITKLILNNINTKLEEYSLDEDINNLMESKSVIEQYSIGLKNKNLAIKNVLSVLKDEKYLEYKNFESSLDLILKSYDQTTKVTDKKVEQLYKKVLKKKR